MSHRVIADLEARSALQVFQVQPAQPAVAVWLRRLLAPVVAACRLQGSYPLELRPMGPWAGFTLGSTFVPDGRVAVSSQLILWSHRSIVATIIHEWTHRLLPDHAHDGAFAALQQALFLRVDAACPPRAGEEGLQLQFAASLYDLQDLPDPLVAHADGGLGEAWRWAMITARSLAPSPFSAEALAAEISGRYKAWVIHLEAAPAAAAARAQTVADGAAAAKATRDELRRANDLLRTVSISLGVAGVAVLAEAFMLLKLAFGGA
ncbi:MAG TPA: hypothetical protein VN280_04695 [Variovorax sp.]|nr:hypothetical protein [Variovorax sp.]